MSRWEVLADGETELTAKRETSVGNRHKKDVVVVTDNAVLVVSIQHPC